jgi:solute carrier family 25 carnitine/acylcarnitine transporter 20/29
MSEDANEFTIDLIAGWASGGCSIFASQPIDTILTRKQAGNAFRSNNFLQGNLTSLWRGSSAMIGTIPLQNGMLMAGYGYGKRFTENMRPNDVLLGVFIGGCSGGLVQSFLMSPVELIKVNQQVAGKSLTSAATLVYTNIFSRFGWKGLQATILRDGIPHGVWFASYEWCKAKMEAMEHFQGSKTAISLSSGAFAAATAWGVGYPFDIVKTRIQASLVPKSVWQTALEIMRESRGNPVSALYKGFSLKLAKAVPASAINFFVYETVADKLKR